MHARTQVQAHEQQQQRAVASKKKESSGLLPLYTTCTPSRPLLATRSLPLLPTIHTHPLPPTRIPEEEVRERGVALIESGGAHGSRAAGNRTRASRSGARVGAAAPRSVSSTLEGSSDSASGGGTGTARVLC